jgi:DNA-directed RNA polymerase specialized sigma24 family protein
MYCVKIKDVFGNETIVEVSFEIYQLFEDERKHMERERNERRKHWDKRDLEDYILANESVVVSETLEDLFFRLDALRTIRDVVRTCTPVQQERFALYVRGYSFAEIARLQHRTERTIRKSVESTLKKINKNL